MRFPSFRVNALAGVTLPAAFVACSLWANGCTAIVNNVTDDCSIDADCTSRGDTYANAVCRDGLCRQVQAPGPEPGGPDWSCVGRVEFKQPTQVTANFSVTLIDPVAGSPLSGMSLRPCGRIDPTCASPITEPVTSNALGIARLTLPTVQATQGVPGFTGYLEITGQGRIPYLYFSNPLVTDRETVLPIGSPEQSQGFAAVLGDFMPDPNLASGAVITKDCQGVAASGVTIGVPEGEGRTRPFYVAGVAPSPDAAATDASGITFVFNVPVGTATISTFRQDTGEQTAKLSIVTRPGFAFLVEIEPTPL